MNTIETRRKRRTHHRRMLFGLGTMIVGAFLLLAVLPPKRGKGPSRS